MTTPQEIASRPPGMGVLRAALTLQYAAGGAVIPFLTLWLGDRGLSFSQISLILSISSLSLAVFPFVWGMIADRYLPLNRLFTLLNLGAFLALAVLVLQTGFTGFLIGMALLTVCLNPTFMLVNALSFHHLPRPEEQFGKLRAWGSLGWIVPFLPISIWCAGAQRVSLDFSIYLGMGICVALAVLTLWLPHTAPGALHRESNGRQHSEYLSSLRRLLSDGNYLVLLISYFLIAGSFSILTYYSFPLLEQRGVPRSWLGPAFAIGVVFEFFLFQWQAALLKRWNYAAIIFLGGLCLALRQALYATVSNVWVLSLSYVLVGAVVAFNFIGTSLLANAIASRDVRATSQTLLVLCGSGLGPVFANWITSLLARHYHQNLRPVFLFATLTAALATLLILLRARNLIQAAEPKRDQF